MYYLSFNFWAKIIFFIILATKKNPYFLRVLFFNLLFSDFLT